MLVAAGVLAGCQTSGETAALPAVSAAFPQSEVEEVLAAGFRRIAERYLEPVTVRDIALEGLKGLASLDPVLSVKSGDGTVGVNLGNNAVTRFKTPDANRVVGWARLVTETVKAGRKLSYDLAKAGEDKIIEAVFDGALGSLDPFSRYAGAEEARKNREKRDGFGGIGILIGVRNGETRVTTVIGETPAARAGIKVGDIISHVGWVPIRGLDEKAVIKQLHGRIGTEIPITVRRHGEERPLAFRMTRSRVVLPTVSARTLRGAVLFKVTGFNQDTAESIARHLKRRRAAHAGPLRGIILDLRGNPGGLLSESIEVADLFLERGQIVSTRGRHRDSVQYYEADSGDISDGLPIVVLIDGKSASATEIVAAALQDRGRAVVVGTTSFGKGTVQTVLGLPNDGEITFTWSRFLAPSGYALHGLGVLPSVCTSGSDKRDAERLVHAALDSPVETAARFDAWRRTPVNDADLHKRQRKICPPQQRRRTVEREVALKIIGDTGIWKQALGLTTEPAVARNPSAAP